jgi:hypothetical protein
VRRAAVPPPLFTMDIINDFSARRFGGPMHLGNSPPRMTRPILEKARKFTVFGHRKAVAF